MPAVGQLKRLNDLFADHCKILQVAKSCQPFFPKYFQINQTKARLSVNLRSQRAQSTNPQIFAHTSVLSSNIVKKLKVPRR